MKRVYFGSVENLAEFMVGNAQEKRSTIVALFYDDALQLMRELLTYEEVEPFTISISSEQFDGYSKEFYITLAGDLQLFIEKAIGPKGGYLNFEDDCLVLYPDTNSAIIEKNYAKESPVYEAIFDGDKELDREDCDLIACKCGKCKTSGGKCRHLGTEGEGNRRSDYLTFDELLRVLFG